MLCFSDIYFEISYTYHTLCPRSSDPFYIVSYYIKWVTPSWTHSIIGEDYLIASTASLCFFTNLTKLEGLRVAKFRHSVKETTLTTVGHKDPSNMNYFTFGTTIISNLLMQAYDE